MKENWIVPCNIKQFNVIEYFNISDTVVWKNSFTIHKDDIVYIYVGAPYSEILYKCVVISDDISDEILEENSYAIVTKPSNNYFSKRIKYIQMRLIKSYEKNTFTLEDLKKHGLGQVQIQARTDRRLQHYIESIEG
ncbi:MAG: hypothetical protein RR681_09410 [Lachnospiraceae bacterium]